MKFIHAEKYALARKKYQEEFLNNYQSVEDQFGGIANRCKALTLSPYKSNDIKALAAVSYEVQLLISNHGAFEESPAGQAVDDLVGYANLLAVDDERS